MDGIVLGLFLFAAFLGGFASGLAGFAMGFVVSGIWLHVITPDTNDGADRRLRPLDAGLRRLETAADTGLADGRAVHHRRHDRRPPRSGAAHLSRSGPRAPRRRRAAGRLQRVRPGQAGLQAAQGRDHDGRQHRISERRAGRADRAAGLHHHRLVPDARLDQGRTARGLPARHPGGNDDDRGIAERRRRHHRPIRSSSMCWAFLRCWPACGWASSATASSTTPRSARWSWCFCCAPEWR